MKYNAWINKGHIDHITLVRRETVGYTIQMMKLKLTLSKNDTLEKKKRKERKKKEKITILADQSCLQMVKLEFF